MASKPCSRAARTAAPATSWWPTTGTGAAWAGGAATRAAMVTPGVALSSLRAASRSLMPSFRATNWMTLPLAWQLEVGASWGLAYDWRRGRLYAAAYLKRGARFGPAGPGGIYQLPTALHWNSLTALVLAATLFMASWTLLRMVPSEPGRRADAVFVPLGITLLLFHFLWFMTAVMHAWGAAADVYRIGGDYLDRPERIRRYAAIARATAKSTTDRFADPPIGERLQLSEAEWRRRLTGKAAVRPDNPVPPRAPHQNASSIGRGARPMSSQICPSWRDFERRNLRRSA